MFVTNSEPFKKINMMRVRVGCHHINPLNPRVKSHQTPYRFSFRSYTGRIRKTNCGSSSHSVLIGVYNIIVCSSGLAVSITRPN